MMLNKSDIKTHLLNKLFHNTEFLIKRKIIDIVKLCIKESNSPPLGIYIITYKDRVYNSLWSIPTLPKENTINIPIPDNLLKTVKHIYMLEKNTIKTKEIIKTYLNNILSNIDNYADLNYVLPKNIWEISNYISDSNAPRNKYIIEYKKEKEDKLNKLEQLVDEILVDKLLTKDII